MLSIPLLHAPSNTLSQLFENFAYKVCDLTIADRVFLPLAASFSHGGISDLSLALLGLLII